MGGPYFINSRKHSRVQTEEKMASVFRFMVVLVTLICAKAAEATNSSDANPKLHLGSSQASLADAVLRLYEGMHKLKIHEDEKIANLSMEIKGEVREKIREMKDETREMVREIKQDQAKIMKNQSDIVKTVEHFKDINGTKVFDLVARFNQFKNDMDNFKNSTVRFEINTKNFTSATERKLETITNELNRGVDDVFVYYPRYTTQNIARKRYTEHRLQFVGYGRPSYWYDRKSKYYTTLEECFDYCKYYKRSYGYNGLTYDSYQCTCYTYDDGSSVRGNPLHYMYY